VVIYGENIMKWLGNHTFMDYFERIVDNVNSIISELDRAKNNIQTNLNGIVLNFPIDDKAKADFVKYELTKDLHEYEIKFLREPETWFPISFFLSELSKLSDDNGYLLDENIKWAKEEITSNRPKLNKLKELIFIIKYHYFHRLMIGTEELFTKALSLMDKLKVYKDVSIISSAIAKEVQVYADDLKLIYNLLAIKLFELERFQKGLSDVGAKLLPESLALFQKESNKKMAAIRRILSLRYNADMAISREILVEEKSIKKDTQHISYFFNNNNHVPAVKRTIPVLPPLLSSTNNKRCRHS
jgi:hypothetical protein